MNNENGAGNDKRSAFQAIKFGMFSIVWVKPQISTKELIYRSRLSGNAIH